MFDRPLTDTWTGCSNNTKNKCYGSCLILAGLSLMWNSLKEHWKHEWISSYDETILLSVVCFGLWEGPSGCSWKARDRLDSGPGGCHEDGSTVYGELQFPPLACFMLTLFCFFHSRSWKQRVCFSFVKGSFLSLQSEFLTCGDQTLRPAAPRVQKLPRVIIEVVRRGRCLHFHFTVPTCSMNEQPPGSRDWTTSSPRTSLPLAFFQSKCVHSAYFSPDRELMQLGGVPENAERAGVIIPQGLLTLMFESRTGIFCFLLPFTVKRKKRELNYGV